MPKPILFAHRWLGVSVGLIMTIWCLSGFVMIYVDYPRLLPSEQLRGLEPLQGTPTSLLGAVDLALDSRVAAASIEMLDGRPVLRIRPAPDPSHPTGQMRDLPGAYDLVAASPLPSLSAQQARVVGQRFAGRLDIHAEATATRIDVDQWTVQTARRQQPLYRVDFGDSAGSALYVAGDSGEIVQQTSRFERFWGWLGAVPHWLYPTLLRQNGELWTQVVVWTSLLGCFLTLTGLWVGIARPRRGAHDPPASHRRSIGWWHHMLGLAAGLLTLTWVASGLLSMNPWGTLDSAAGAAEAQRLQRISTWSKARAAMTAIKEIPRGTVRLQLAPLGEQVFVIATSVDGSTIRLGRDGRPAPLGREELESALRRSGPLASLDLMRSEDDYYYAHRSSVALPVWRAIRADDQRTRLYIDPQSGTLLRVVDRDGRGFRWLHNGLHSLDLPGLRARPIRDLILLPLLMAVTLVCATGTWMGWRRIARDTVRRRRRRTGAS